jgi:septum formation protein
VSDLKRLVLASASPRRRELLNGLGVEFVVRAPDIDEAQLPGEDPFAYVRRLALEKARAAATMGTAKEWVLGADTTVVVDGRIFGKPADDDDAQRMLEALAGRHHEVLTGVALIADGREQVVLESTKVFFAPMSAAEIDDYVKSGEPRDKAGAYAIQGRGAAFVTRIEGSYSNVVGLPLHRVYALLRALSCRT